MANVRVRYEGTASIIVQDKAWYQDEIHEIDEKLAQALVAFGEKIVVLPAAGGDETGAAVADDTADDAADEVVEQVAPKAKRKR